MTIREKFADLSYLVSKYKDNHMALLLGVGVSWNKLRAGDKPTSFFTCLLAGARSCVWQRAGLYVRIGGEDCLLGLASRIDGQGGKKPVFYAALKVSVGNPYCP